MSEFNPFGADEAPVAVVEESEEAGNRNRVLALGAVAAVALGAGAFMLLSGGGDAEEDFVPVKRAPRAAAPAASPAPVAKLPASSTLTLGRNPFRALYVAPASASGPGSGATTGTTPTTTTTTTTGGAPTTVFVGGSTSGGTTSGGSTTGGTTSGGTTSGGSTTGGTPAQPAPAPAQSTVALRSVAAGKDGSAPTGSFVYDGKQVTGAPGDVMEGKLLVISIQQDNTGGWFANLQLGDGAPFEVHERQTVVVQ